MNRWSPYHDLFWSLLGTQLAAQAGDNQQREAAFAWLSSVITAPERTGERGDIVRTLEDSILLLLTNIPEDKLDAKEVRQFVMRLLLPLLQGPLIQDIDGTLRRLLGFVFRLPAEGRTTAQYTVESVSGSVDVSISEQEEEETVLRLLQEAWTRRIPTDIEFHRARVKTTLEKAVPELGGHICVAVDMPAIHLVLADLTNLQQLGPPLIEYMADSYSAVDPPLAAQVLALSPTLLAEDHAIRRTGLRRLCLAYLQSTYFEWKRDLVHGVNKLRDAPLEKVEALCTLPIIPEPMDADTICIAFAQAIAEERFAIPDGAKKLFFLLSPTVFPTIFPILGTVWDNYEASALENRAPPDMVLQRWCHSILYPISLFESLGMFASLLSVAAMRPQLQVPITDQEQLSLRQWLQGYIHFMLCCSDTERTDATESITAPFRDVYAVERMRRESHALSLQCGLWIAASPQHTRAWEAQGSIADVIVQNWLVRGIVLAERILPILVSHGESIEEMQAEIDRVRERFSFAIDIGSYPDAFNPFLFGLKQYDHGLVCLLRILEVTWDTTVAGDEKGGRPYWWTDSIQKALIALAAQAETEGENQWRSARDLGKENRLRLVCDQLPSDYARLLLAHNDPTNSSE